MAAKQKAGFQKKQRGWFSNAFTKFTRFFSRWKNYGQRHGAQQPAPQNAGPNPAAVPQQNAANVNAGQVAALAPVNNAANVNPGGNNDPLQMAAAIAGGNAADQIAANQAPNLNPINQAIQAYQENPLDMSMIAVAPKRKNLKKKKKKKK